MDIAKKMGKLNLLFSDICYYKDLKPYLTEGWYIIQLDDKEWNCFYYGKKIFYFSRHGIPPPLLIHCKLQDYTQNTFDIQPLETCTCSSYTCIIFIAAFRNQEPTLVVYESFIDFWDESKLKNDEIILKMIEKIDE